MTTAPEPRVWKLEIRPPAPFLTLNDRRDRRSNAPRPWRTAGWAAAKQAKLPTGLSRVRIDVVVWLPPDSDPDEENLRATTKALVDGLGPPFLRRPSGKSRGAAAPGYGLITNDNRKHLDGPHLVITDHPRPPIGHVVVYITDLTNVPAGRTWTPTIRTSTADARTTAKRVCNGCGRRLGDVTAAEVAAAIDGRPLSDVRGECPTCKEATS